MRTHYSLECIFYIAQIWIHLYIEITQTLRIYVFENIIIYVNVMNIPTLTCIGPVSTSMLWTSQHWPVSVQCPRQCYEHLNADLYRSSVHVNVMNISALTCIGPVSTGSAIRVIHRHQIGTSRKTAATRTPSWTPVALNTQLTPVALNTQLNTCCIEHPVDTCCIEHPVDTCCIEHPVDTCCIEHPVEHLLHWTHSWTRIALNTYLTPATLNKNTVFQLYQVLKASRFLE